MPSTRSLPIRSWRPWASGVAAASPAVHGHAHGVSFLSGLLWEGKRAAGRRVPVAASSRRRTLALGLYSCQKPPERAVRAARFPTATQAQQEGAMSNLSQTPAAQRLPEAERHEASKFTLGGGDGRHRCVLHRRHRLGVHLRQGHQPARSARRQAAGCERAGRDHRLGRHRCANKAAGFANFLDFKAATCARWSQSALTQRSKEPCRRSPS